MIYYDVYLQSKPDAIGKWTNYREYVKLRETRVMDTSKFIINQKKN